MRFEQVVLRVSGRASRVSVAFIDGRPALRLHLVAKKLGWAFCYALAGRAGGSRGRSSARPMDSRMSGTGIPALKAPEASSRSTWSELLSVLSRRQFPQDGERCASPHRLGRAPECPRAQLALASEHLVLDWRLAACRRWVSTTASNSDATQDSEGSCLIGKLT